VGWTALQFPWVDCPLKEEELEIVNSHDMPGIEGMNMEMIQIFTECQTFGDQYGYEPQTDYREKSRLQVNRSLIFGQVEGEQ
jgi:hypothetical protein